jgi:GR25 family glycosyltransferase involved in LPS biosynthesis
MKLSDVPIVCISLNRRPDRWETIQTGAAASGLDVQRLEAVDAKEFVAHKHPDITLGTAHNILFGKRRAHYEIDSAGAIGASLSHFKAWKQLKDSSAPAMIVFEDDLHIPADLKDRLETVLSVAPDEWDMIQLQQTEFGDGSKGCAPMKGASADNPWTVCTSLMGAHAYIVSQRGAARLLEKAYPIEMHVDAYMAYMSRMQHIRMLWHPLINLQVEYQGSDIDHGEDPILQVPTDMKKAGVVAMKVNAILGLMTMAALAGGILAVAFVGRRFIGK